MSGTTSDARSPGWAENPDHGLGFDPSPRRVRVRFNGEIVADSESMRLMREDGSYIPVYYFPRDDVRMDLLSKSGHTTHCGYKGVASHFDIDAGGKIGADAAWSYESPPAQAAAIAGYIGFHWDSVDHWYEEEDEIFACPRDPNHRVDVVNASRRVEAVLGGEKLAETTRPRVVYETGLPPRFYVAQEDISMDLLEPSDTRTRCPYKGVAVYWSVRVAGNLHEDVVWSYPDPIAECPKLKGYFCFNKERMDGVFVDGKPAP